VTLSRALSPKDCLYSGLGKMDTVKAVTDMCDGKQSLALGNSRLRLGTVACAWEQSLALGNSRLRLETVACAWKQSLALGGTYQNTSL